MFSPNLNGAFPHVFCEKYGKFEELISTLVFALLTVIDETPVHN